MDLCNLAIGIKANGSKCLEWILGLLWDVISMSRTQDGEILEMEICGIASIKTFSCNKEATFGG